MINIRILIQRIKNMDRKKLITYSVLGSIVMLLLIITGFSMILRGDSTYSPLVTTKLRAALLTYKRTVVIKGATPTPVGAGGLPTIAATTPGNNSNPPISGLTAIPTRQQSVPTNAAPTEEPSPTDTVIFDESNTSENVTTEPTETPADEVTESPTDTPTEEVTEEASPTQTTTLPETGSVQYPIILFISASVFLFISFLF